MTDQSEHKAFTEHQETITSEHTDYAPRPDGSQSNGYSPSAKEASNNEHRHHMPHPHLHHRHRHAKLRSRLGLAPEHPVDEEHSIITVEHHGLWWPRIRSIFREPFAEFWGTFVMILFGDGSVAQVLLSTGEKAAPGGMGFGPYQSISWGWGLGVMLGIYVAGDSGGFLNPAITFCFCFYRNLPWRRFPIYMLAQVLGAYLGSGVVYANYYKAIDAREGPGIRTVPPSETATAGVFATYPQPFLTNGTQFLSDFITASILMFVIFALKDESNTGAMGKSGAGKFFPLALFFLIFGLGACFGWETGYAINLARDFGPRLMSYTVGYPYEVWSAGGYYFWVPMVASFVGCMWGGFLYDLFIYTGPDSPLNSPYFGIGRYIDIGESSSSPPMRDAEKEKTSAENAV